jgi:hypothetical protein
MISGKGILYTVIAAAGAAVVAGSVLTGGRRGETMRKFTSGVQNFISNLSGRRNAIDSPPQAMRRAEFDQAHSMGRS